MKTMKPGLVSVTFRRLSPDEIVALCRGSGIEWIEWGGDVHVPLGEIETARRVGALTRENGLHVACYGSYVRMTSAERALFPDLVATARALGAPALRVWSGASDDADPDEIAESTRLLCDMAPEMIITFEFHGGTLTRDDEHACDFLRRVDRPNVRTQWQPPLNWPEADCLRAIGAVKPWLYNLHVFSWEGVNRLPLSAHADRWKKYLRAAAGDRLALMEFVIDDDPDQFVRDAATLRGWLEELL